MWLSTVDRFKHADATGAVELDGAALRKLQEVLAGMVADVDGVCRRNGITYTLGGGVALGAVRHRGFIPWDDDVDLNMPRADYERFVPAFRREMGHKYWVHTPRETRGYGLALMRIRLRGTCVITREDSRLPEEECGAFVDVFIIENTFDNAFLRFFHGVGSLALGFLYSCRKFFDERRLVSRMLVGGGRPLAFRVKTGIGMLVSFMSLDAWTSLWDRWNSLCGNNRSRWVTIPVGRRHFFVETGLRSDMCETVPGSFEGMELPLPSGVDGYLRRLYGADYMIPPPADMREKHVFLQPFRL